MNIETTQLKTIQDIKAYLKLKKPTLFHGSQTSTVIPYERIEATCEQMGWESFFMANLGQLKPSLELGQDGVLTIRGPVTWKEAREFCQPKGRTIMTSPTEELASMLAGVATSCTGERCFGFGTYRDHLIELSYLDHEGVLHKLSYEKSLKDHRIFSSKRGIELLKEYQKTYEFYSKFKNAPFPRLERETDLMTGTEGQLGVIVEAKVKTTPLVNVTYIFLALPKWEVDYSLHLRLFEKVQNLRNKIFSCELVDENSWSYLDDELIPRKGKDIIFLEITDEHFEEVYESVLSHFPELPEEDIFQVGESKCKSLRMEIPRAVFEVNTKMGVVKKGTDVQTTPEKFEGLMKFYKKMTEAGVDYNLFGHFGDAHLHFNYMPSPDQANSCQEELEKLYKWVGQVKGSPFAEHGIGILKGPFIRTFYEDIHFEMFHYLKKEMDPENIFFPQGFMSYERERTRA